MATNPLIGASWGGANGQQPGTSASFNAAGGSNPISAPPTPYGWKYGNPFGLSDPTGTGSVNKNLALENITSAQMKNALAPQWASLMGQYGGAAGEFFQNLSNLGSPFYQQKQAEAFNQGNQQNQNAAGQAKQQLAAQGYGYTPSGANAAMIGGMAQSGAQDLSEQYLQNLFQNEQLQLAGAQGEAGIAGMFNPSSLLGGTSLGTTINSPSNFFQDFASIMGSLSGAGGSSTSPSGASTAITL